MTPPRLLRLVLPAALLLVFAACAKAPSHDDQIVARDDAAFDTWIAAHNTVLTADEIHDLNEARQLLKFKVMTQSPGLPPDQFAAALYQEIDGHTANDVLITACKLKIDAAEIKLADFAPLVAKYQAYDHNPSLTDDQRADVKDKLRQLDEKVGAQQAELAQQQQRLAALQAAAPAAH